MPARILIIEDNSANLELMAYLLAAQGYAPITATDGEAGLAIAPQCVPDLIVCDLQMPGADGYAVARRAKQHGALRDIPLVAVSAYAMVGDREKALAAGFDGYLSKPIDPENFATRLAAYLRPELRLAPGAPAAAVTDSPRRRNSKGRTILVVDNLQANRELAVDLLEYSGYTVVTAHGARNALELARRAPPDLILSDVCMPDASGYALIREIKREPGLRAIPFVFLTSTAINEADRRHGLALGAAKFLFRPLEPEVLLREVESCLPERTQS